MGVVLQGRGEYLASLATGTGLKLCHLVFGLWRFAFLPVSLGPAGDCPCKDLAKLGGRATRQKSNSVFGL